MTELSASAAALVAARSNRATIDALPSTPASVAAAHAIQDEITAALNETVGAFKANAPPGGETTRGVIYASVIYPSPADIPVVEAPACGVEAEVAFRATAGFPPRATDYTREEVAAGAAVLPVIEIVSSRFADSKARPEFERIADSISNAGLVLGEARDDWAGLDLSRLHVRLAINGETKIDKQGGHPTDDPLGVATALINLMRTSSGVAAGQVIITGSWTGVLFLQPGDRCSISFEHLGDVDVTFNA